MMSPDERCGASSSATAFFSSTELVNSVVPWLATLSDVSRVSRVSWAAHGLNWGLFCSSASKHDWQSARDFGGLKKAKLVACVARLAAGAEAPPGSAAEARAGVAAFLLGDSCRSRIPVERLDDEAVKNVRLVCRGGGVGMLACVFELARRPTAGPWELQQACGWALHTLLLGAAREDAAAVGAATAIEAAELMSRLRVVTVALTHLRQRRGAGLEATCACLVGRFEVVASLARSVDRRQAALMGPLERMNGMSALLEYACRDGEDDHARARGAAVEACRRRSSEVDEDDRLVVARLVVARATPRRSEASPAAVKALACLARALPNELAAAGAVCILADVLVAADRAVADKLEPPSPRRRRRPRDPPARSRRSTAAAVSFPATVALDRVRLLDLAADAALGLARIARRSALRRSGRDRFGRAQADLQAAVLDALPGGFVLAKFLRPPEDDAPTEVRHARDRAADMCAVALSNLAAGSEFNRASLVAAGVGDALREARAVRKTSPALDAALRALRASAASPSRANGHDPDLFYYESGDDDDEEDDYSFSSEESEGFEEEEDDDDDEEDDEEEDDDDDAAEIDDDDFAFDDFFPAA